MLDLSAELAEGRATAAALLASTCKITRASSERGPLNPDTLKYDELAPQLVYEGPCRVQIARDSDRSDEVGDRTARIGDRELQLPVDGTGSVSTGDVVTILTNPADRALVGRVYTVTSRHEKTHAITRRLAVQEVTG
ncbi:hypothetical protein QE370_000453 [Aeromicrobium sp. SORGH_AS981]|uniref:DUF6093 family protein n=1 Tax=Aeromicrobium sp. SORGH_AS_0981 TaxID=3041802 RepID=UPI0028618609|nr:DUF6093 family protein [Aeromicrobium sp. SORGH_AS_0981]MDR6117269.1 hypothetical protein [Aeromicrobium sp. SORGH_AS_0981]